MIQQHIRLLIEYDGTPYHGWQLQRGHPTVEGTLTDVLRQLTGEPDLAVKAAGRTDAGVHAYGQVASFVTSCPKEARRFTPALNRFLPSSIRIHRSDAVPPHFNPRLDARRKRYRYRIYAGPHCTALDQYRAWHLQRGLVIPYMHQAAAPLLGEHDFNAFRSAHCDAPHARRRMDAIVISTQPRPPVGQFIDLLFTANAFCRHMCRILAGTLAEAGSGQRSVDSVHRALISRDRQQAGMTAPPWGLALMGVEYEGQALSKD